MKVLRDISLSAINAGFVTVLVGFTSSAVIVVQAAQSLGADAGQIASWMWALGIGMGVTCIGLSLRFKVPLATAWSTSGAALLISNNAHLSMNEAIGAFIFSGILITIVGFTGWFERVIDRIPLSIAAGMLAGVLLRFGLDAFGALHEDFPMAFAMLMTYLVARRLMPRYAVVLALLVGSALAWRANTLLLGDVRWELAMPIFTAPEFSITALLGIGLPLFAVTMASQNVPGVAVIRASGYRVPISSAIGWTGATTVLLAPFGAFALNMATITSAICVGPEAHENPKKRYMAAVAAGVFYCLTGIYGATIGALFMAFPKVLVLVIAGLALIGTIGNALAIAMGDEARREAALICFLVTASGVTIAGIGSAFWGLVAGSVAWFVLRPRSVDKSTASSDQDKPRTPQSPASPVARPSDNATVRQPDRTV